MMFGFVLHINNIYLHEDVINTFLLTVVLMLET